MRCTHWNLLDTSAAIPTASPPFSRMAFATRSTRSGLRSLMTTFAPCAAKQCASAAPMPCPAPVMMANRAIPHWGDYFCEQEEQQVGCNWKAYNELKDKDLSLTAREEMQHRINEYGCVDLIPHHKADGGELSATPHVYSNGSVNKNHQQRLEGWRSWDMVAEKRLGSNHGIVNLGKYTTMRICEEGFLWVATFNNSMNSPTRC